MNQIAHDYPTVLLDKRQGPHLSLYQPTHLQHPENLQDPIRFRTLVKRLETGLRKEFPSHDIDALLKPFEALAEDSAFWNHTARGLAVFAADGFFRTYKLLRPVVELASVADNFHTKPLLRIVQSADSYQVLSLNRKTFSIYEGNRDALYEVQPIEGLSHTAEGIQKMGASDREGAHRAYGPSPASAAAHHGTDVKQDLRDRDTERFFRAVDEMVLEHYSQPSGHRLILAALPQHHQLFRKISRNPFLIDEGIRTDPATLSADMLRERAWELLLPYYQKRLAGFVDAFGAASGTGLASADLDAITTAAMDGRIETLLIEADRIIPGRLNIAAGKTGTDDSSNPEVEDVLDEISEYVLRSGGEAIMVPTDRMPTQTGAAAIFRF